MERKIANKSFVSHSINIRLLHLLAVILLSAHLGIFVHADSKELYDETSSPQDVDRFLNDVGTSDIIEKLKRSWKSLQGSWGKRSDEATIEDNYDSQPDWTFIKPSENSKDPKPEPNIETEAMKYFVLYATNPDAVPTSIGVTSTGNLQDLGASNFEKKNWKNMNVAWGKRRSAVWNKFRGAWGKREPAWNNLKGMWGKRSTKDWKKLQSAWGKRSQQQQTK